MDAADPIRVHLVCNARFHDTDFARRELLALLGEHNDVVTTVAGDYRDVAAMAQSRLLVTYTCDLRPSADEVAALERFLAAGGRWFALHGTNAILEFVGAGVLVDGIRLPGKADTPDLAPGLMRLLGSRFVAHPANQALDVRIAAPDHPIVRGLEPFTVVDEPYYCEFHGEHTTLLEADYDAPSTGYVTEHWPVPGPHPVLYLHPHGRGEVVYLTLGHCRGRFDLRPFMAVAPIERCSWESPVFMDVLRRCLAWGLRDA